MKKPLLILIGITTTVLTLYFFFEELSWEKRTRVTFGTVGHAEWKQRSGSFYQIGYIATNGTYSFEAHPLFEFSLEKTAGEQVKVRYKIDNPADAKIESFSNRFGKTLFALSLGLLVLLGITAKVR